MGHCARLTNELDSPIFERRLHSSAGEWRGFIVRASRDTAVTYRRTLGRELTGYPVLDNAIFVRAERDIPHHVRAEHLHAPVAMLEQPSEWFGCRVRRWSGCVGDVVSPRLGASF